MGNKPVTGRSVSPMSSSDHEVTFVQPAADDTASATVSMSDEVASRSATASPRPASAVSRPASADVLMSANDTTSIPSSSRPASVASRSHTGLGTSSAPSPAPETHTLPDASSSAAGTTSIASSQPELQPKPQDKPLQELQLRQQQQEDQKQQLLQQQFDAESNRIVEEEMYNRNREARRAELVAAMREKNKLIKQQKLEQKKEEKRKYDRMYQEMSAKWHNQQMLLAVRGYLGHERDTQFYRYLAFLKEQSEKCGHDVDNILRSNGIHTGSTPESSRSSSSSTKRSGSGASSNKSKSVGSDKVSIEDETSPKPCCSKSKDSSPQPSTSGSIHSSSSRISSASRVRSRPPSAATRCSSRLSTKSGIQDGRMSSTSGRITDNSDAVSREVTAMDTVADVHVCELEEPVVGESPAIPECADSDAVDSENKENGPLEASTPDSVQTNSPSPKPLPAPRGSAKVKARKRVRPAGTLHMTTAQIAARQEAFEKGIKQQTENSRKRIQQASSFGTFRIDSLGSEETERESQAMTPVMSPRHLGTPGSRPSSSSSRSGRSSRAVSPAPSLRSVSPVAPASRTATVDLQPSGAEAVALRAASAKSAATRQDRGSTRSDMADSAYSSSSEKMNND